MQVEEAKYVIRVHADGTKERRLKCRSGFKRVDGKCVLMTGKEKIAKKIAIRKAIRTKNADPSLKKKATRRRLKALRKRQSYGYHNGS